MIDQIIDLYFNQQLSLAVVADKMGTYPNKVRRLLLDSGYSLRDKKASQTLALEKGRAKHPTKGKHQSKKTKENISKSMVKAWEQKPIEAKQKVSAVAKERWNSRTEAKKAEFSKQAAKGVRRVAKNGSKMEQFLMSKLTEYEFRPQRQRENLVFSEQMRVDIFLPHDKIAIEVDGPMHFEPIWGQEFLEKKLNEDQRKNGLLLYSGYHIIRIRIRKKTLNQQYKEQVWSRLYWAIEDLSKQSKPQLVLLEIDKL